MNGLEEIKDYVEKRQKEGKGNFDFTIEALCCSSLFLLFPSQYSSEACNSPSQFFPQAYHSQISRKSSNLYSQSLLEIHPLLQIVLDIVNEYH